METKVLLKQLTEFVGVSGAEENITQWLSKRLAPYGEVKVDTLHNVSCTFGEGYHILLDAHLDEIGMIVKSITEDGFIKVAACGGIDCRMLPAAEVSVWGKEVLHGVISTLPPHLKSKDDENKAASIEDIAIDIGMNREEAEQYVSIGDRVTFRRNFTPLLNHQICASVLDDRSGIAAILLALEELRQLPVKITVLFSAQEEVGTRGAKIGAFAAQAEEAIVVDVSFGFSPLCKKSDCGEIGKGAMIGFSPILDTDMSRALVKIAEEVQIPYQKEVMGGGKTGTNADVISVCACGVKTALLSIPLKYMHSPSEVVDVRDIEAVSALICAYIKQRAGEINA